MTTKSLDQLLEDIRSGRPDRMFEAYQSIIEIGSDVVQEIIPRLDDENTLVRWVAAGVLGEIRATEAIPSLEARLQDDNISVRIRAAESLARLQNTNGIETLIDALSSEDVMIGHPPELASDYANQVLVSFTGQNFGFDGSAPSSEKERSISRWREWWEQNKDQFQL